MASTEKPAELPCLVRGDCVSFEYTLAARSKVARKGPIRLAESILGRYLSIGQSIRTKGD